MNWNRHKRNTSDCNHIKINAGQNQCKWFFFFYDSIENFPHTHSFNVDWFFFVVLHSFVEMYFAPASVFPTSNFRVLKLKTKERKKNNEKHYQSQFLRFNHVYQSWISLYWMMNSFLSATIFALLSFSRSMQLYSIPYDFYFLFSLLRLSV